VIMAQRAMIGDVFGAKAPVQVSAIRRRNLKPSFHSLKMRHFMFQRPQNDFKPKSSAKHQEERDLFYDYYSDNTSQL